jgi:hypothetical protein
VNRLTRLFPLAAGLFGVAFIFACTDEITAPGSPDFAVTSLEPVSAFAECSQVESSAKAWIGAKGGTLRAGKHVLQVPAGALNATTLITLQAPSDTISRVRLGPEGLTFSKMYPAYLMMSYDDCVVDPDERQQIVHVDQSLRIIGIPPSQDDPLTQRVSAKLVVLMSTYAVAY